MELAQISNTLDSRLNAFSPGGIQKDEYEKSLYLTQAQDIYYESLLDMFEDTSSISSDLVPFISNLTITTASPTLFGGFEVDLGIPVKRILRERVMISSPTHPIHDGKILKVSEERLAEIEESLKNPFRVPGEVEALRVMSESEELDMVEIYLPTWATFTSYDVTIAKRLDPIILEDLPDGLTVKDQNTASANILFSDSDINKIIDLALNLILRDMGLLRQEQPQKQEAQ